MLPGRATQLGIFAKTFAGATAEAVLAQTRQAGYAMVQYNMACSGLSALPTVLDPREINALRAASSTTGVALAALSATYNMSHPDAAVRRAGHRALGVLAAAAQALNIPVLTLCTGSRNATDQWAAHPDNSSPESWRTLLASMEAAIDVAERHDVLIAIEPEPANVVSSAARARLLLDELGSARVRIVFDGANLLDASTLCAGSDAMHREFLGALEQLSQQIVLVHAKDRTLDGAVVPAGRGAMDYAVYFDALAAARVDVPIITHGLDAAAAPDVAAFLRERLSALPGSAQ